MLRDLIGIPFVDHGRIVEAWIVGVCDGGDARVRKEAPDFDVVCFDTLPINGNLRARMRDWMTVCDPEPGDVGRHRLDAMYPTWCSRGVYIGSGRFIHT